MRPSKGCCHFCALLKLVPRNPGEYLKKTRDQPQVIFPCAIFFHGASQIKLASLYTDNINI